jgi:hypothetical protein
MDALHRAAWTAVSGPLSDAQHDEITAALQLPVRLPML